MDKARPSLEDDLQLLAIADFEESGVLIVEHAPDFTDWRLKIGLFPEDSEIGKVITQYGLGGIDVCLRFVGRFPHDPPYVRILSPVVQVANSGNIYVNSRQSLGPGFWEGVWNPSLSVQDIIQKIKAGLVQHQAFIDTVKSKLQKAPPKKPEVVHKYVPSNTGVDLKKLREEAELAKKNAEREKLNETREDRELAEALKRSLQPTPPPKPKEISPELEELRRLQEERMKEAKRGGVHTVVKQPEPTPPPKVTHPRPPAPEVGPSAAMEEVKRLQQEKMKAAKEKDVRQNTPYQSPS